MPKVMGALPNINGALCSTPQSLADVHYIGQLFHGHRDARLTTANTVPRRIRHNDTRLGLFNARSVADKSTAVQQWISEMKLDLAALVETWHDDATSPQLLACAPPGYKLSLIHI